MVNHSNVIAVHSGNNVIPLQSGPALTDESLSVALATDSVITTVDAGISQTTLRTVVVSADLTTTTDVTIAPTATETIVITDIIVSAGTAMSVLFEEETSGTDIVKVFLPANGFAQVTTHGKLKLDTPDKKLRATASAAGNISITVLYYSE